MEKGRLEKPPSISEKRWYAASICRIASGRLEHRGVEPTDSNIREYIKTVWKNYKEKIEINHRAALLRKNEIAEVAKKYPDSIQPDIKAQIELIERYDHAVVDSLMIVGDIVLQGESRSAERR